MVDSVWFDSYLRTDREGEMSEDEYFLDMEQRNEIKRNTEIMLKAVTAAQDFVESQGNQLGTITLRKAFEMGFRQGYTSK